MCTGGREIGPTGTHSQFLNVHGEFSESGVSVLLLATSPVLDIHLYGVALGVANATR